MIILGFGNKARNGKDTAATGIQEFCVDHSTPCKRVGFADALKREVNDALTRHGGDIEMLLAYGPEPGVPFPDYVKADPNPDMSDPMMPLGKHSLLLQWWGTEYRRRWRPNYWIEQFKRSIDESVGVIVVPDMRFTNEAIAITELGGATVNVRRLNEDGTQYLDKSRPAGHQSEIELDGWNYDYRVIAKSGQMSLVKAYAVEILKHQMRLVRKWEN
jgi:hypothetical protein